METKKEKKITTSQLLTILKTTGEFADFDTVYRDRNDITTLGNYLYLLMEKYRKPAKEMIAASGIERSYFYHVLSGQKTPGRNILLRLCLCLPATLSETNAALRYAGHGELYPRIRRDAVIIYGIIRKRTMEEINRALLEENEQPLYREDM